MELYEYFYKYKVNMTKLAEELNMSRASLSAIKWKKRKPHRSTAEKISKATNGMVSVEELLNVNEDEKEI